MTPNLRVRLQLAGPSGGSGAPLSCFWSSQLSLLTVLTLPLQGGGGGLSLNSPQHDQVDTASIPALLRQVTVENKHG